MLMVEILNVSSLAYADTVAAVKATSPRLAMDALYRVHGECYQSRSRAGITSQMLETPPVSAYFCSHIHRIGSDFHRKIRRHDKIFDEYVDKI